MNGERDVAGGLAVRGYCSPFVSLIGGKSAAVQPKKPKKERNPTYGFGDYFSYFSFLSFSDPYTHKFLVGLL